MIYAPVLIPTVNRYEHFRKCLESLSHCRWADKTDVYVAVDYPGREEDWEGYRKIKDYLEHCGNLCFHSLNVTYRETNYFFSGKGNLGTLLKEVLKKYDRFIISEDDNVFSPNFLVYINKGLDSFENDKSIFAVIGYLPPLEIRYPECSSYIRQNVDFYAWGYGMWKGRYENMHSFFDAKGFYYTFCLSNLIKMFKNGRYRFNLYLQLSSRRNRKLKRGDNNLSVYMAINDMDVVMPTESLVRNEGWDDSGIHCPSSNKDLAERIMNQQISTKRSFNFCGSGLEFYECNRSVFSKNPEREFITVYRLLINFFKFVVKRTLSLINNNY